MKKYIKSADQRIMKEVIGAAAAAVFSVLQFVMLDYSCNIDLELSEYTTQKASGFFALNILILFVMNLIIKLFVGKWSLTLLISSIFITVWSIANYYTVLYHGSPLYPSELRSAKTAVDVMGGYSFEIDQHVQVLLVIGAVMLVVSAVYLYKERRQKFYCLKKALLTAAGALVGILGIYILLYSPVRIAPKTLVGWDWKHGVTNYGFPVTSVDDAKKMIISISKPDGYSASKVKEYDPSGINGTAQQYPDVVFILNESYFNIDDYIKTGADMDYMEGFYGLRNAVYGHSTSARNGGGTNDSEFEILTGNSMALMKSYAPFNYYDFAKYQDDYVHCFKELGYNTAALHAGRASNYNRNKVYPQLGFDDVLLGYENFKYKKFKIGSRIRTDRNNYFDLIDHYNALGDGPRFLYLLTYQNHGGYENNDDELDVVHVSEDFGDLTDDMNEYLSSISYSSKAFKDLILHFRHSDRPVIVCMTGDHAPSFVKNLENTGYTKDEKSLKCLMVPYVIWSNIDLNTEGIYTDNICHYELMAMIWKMAGLPMTAYQKTMLDLHEAVPVVANNGLCMDREGKIMPIEESPAKDLIDKYYYLEYNTLKHDSGYREEMFTLPR